eukprot:TRINITY_DN2672_c0_g1_i2.p1 TRINITY_DN2672_c0_g1~~TRINITY_DN2672_c0_g1_i2.p1  ORF type:complete len:956 (+),score=340.84 TRINITY_DN2672_c0_g1_i2:606-3473(+)
MKLDGDRTSFYDERHTQGLGHDPELESLIHDADMESHVRQAEASATLRNGQVMDLKRERDSVESQVESKEVEIHSAEQRIQHFEMLIKEAERCEKTEEEHYEKYANQKEKHSEDSARLKDQKAKLELQSKLKNELMHESDTIAQDKRTYQGYEREEAAHQHQEAEEEERFHTFERKAEKDKLEEKQARAMFQEQKTLAEKETAKQREDWAEVRKQRSRMRHDEDKELSTKAEAKKAEARRLEARHIKLQSRDEAASREREQEKLDSRIAKENVQLQRTERDEALAKDQEMSAMRKKHGLKMEVVDLKKESRIAANDERHAKNTARRDFETSVAMHDKADFQNKKNLQDKDMILEEKQKQEDSQIAATRDQRMVDQTEESKSAYDSLEKKAQGDIQKEKGAINSLSGALQSLGQNSAMSAKIQEAKSKLIDAGNKAKDIAEKVLKGLRDAGQAAGSLARSAPEAAKGPLMAAANAADKIADIGEQKVMTILKSTLNTLNNDANSEQAKQEDMFMNMREDLAKREGAEMGVEADSQQVEQAQTAKLEQTSDISYEKKQQKDAEFAEKQAIVDQAKEKADAAKTGTSGDFYLKKADDLQRQGTEEETDVLKRKEESADRKAKLKVASKETNNARRDQVRAETTAEKLRQQERELKYDLRDEKSKATTNKHLKNDFERKAKENRRIENKSRQQVLAADETLIHLRDDADKARTAMGVAAKDERTAEFAAKRASAKEVTAQDTEKIKAKQYEDDHRWAEQYEAKMRKEKMAAHEDEVKAQATMQDMNKAEAKKTKLQFEIDENRSKFHDHTQQTIIDDHAARQAEDEAAHAKHQEWKCKNKAQLYRREVSRLRMDVAKMNRELQILKEKIDHINAEIERISRSETRYHTQASGYKEAKEMGHEHGFDSVEAAEKALDAAELSVVPDVTLLLQDDSDADDAGDVGAALVSDFALANPDGLQ